MSQTGTINPVSENRHLRDNDLDTNRKLGLIFSRGALAVTPVSKSTSTTLTVKDTVVLIDASSSNLVTTLPPANAWGDGRTPMLFISRVDNSGFTCGISASGTDTLQGVTTINLAPTGTPPGVGITIVSDGISAWWITGQY